MVTITGFLDTLLAASIGGVPFQIIDTSAEVGRRLQRFLFPGLDAPAFEDLGQLDGPIALRGVLIGDDYVEQAKTLASVLGAPGPLSLVHPWLGNIRVVLVSPARISYSHQQLRCARFEVQLWRWQPPPTPPFNTFSALMNAAAQLQVDVSAYMANALAPIGAAYAAFSTAQGWVRSISTQFAALVDTGSSAAEIGPAAAPALAILAAPTPAPSAGWQATTVASVLAVPSAIAGSATPPIPAAVAPGGPTTPGAASDPRDATAMLLAAAGIAASSATGAMPLPQLGAGLQAACVGQAVQTAALIEYSSAQDAATEAATLFAALDAAIAAAGALAATDPLDAAALWQDLTALKATFAADMNMLIGSLPQVVTVSLVAAVPAWLLAHYVSADEPSQMYATWQDLLTRNQVVTPAAMGPGEIEVLNTAA